ncbi:MAG: 6-carboxytetrahydropterin synthase [Dehalococcoidia bacterium]
MTVYRLGIRRDFIAQHFLVGGDFGDENTLHSHHYVLEARLDGDALDRHGYLVDLLEFEAILDDLCRRYRDQTLNEQPEFDGLNPSIELFARILCLALEARLPRGTIGRVEVRLWENDSAWASYAVERG